MFKKSAIILTLLVSLGSLTGCETTLPTSLKQMLPTRGPTSQVTMTDEEIRNAAIQELSRLPSSNIPLTQEEREKAWAKLVELTDTDWDWITLEQLPDLFGKPLIAKRYPGYSIVNFSDTGTIYLTISQEQHWVMDFKYRGRLNASCDPFFKRLNRYLSIGKTDADRRAIYKEMSKILAELEADTKLAERELRIRQENERIQRETPIMLKKRGLRICKRDNFEKEYPHYVGYIEDAADGKIKIQVNDYWIYKGIQPGGFKAQIIWDYPQKWRICE